MRILILSNKPPYPPRDGGAAATDSMIRGLIGAGHQVGLLAVNDPKYHIRAEDVPLSYSDALLSFRLVNVDLSVRPVPALVSILRKRSYHVSRFNTPAFREALVEELSNPYDIVQFETIYPAVYHPVVRSHSRAALVLRAHNIEHHIWSQVASHQQNPLKRMILNEMTKTLRRYELDLFDRMDGIFAITHRDKAFIEMTTCRTPVYPVPFGLDIETFREHAPGRREQTLFHIGSMDWIPNQEGIRWFLERVWPGLHQRRPGIRLVLAGRNMPSWLSGLNSAGITIAGEVPDAVDFIANHDIMIAPLFSGSGVRIKILEGMLAAKPVVATSKALEGIDCKPGEHLLTADTPEDFQQAVLKCFDDIEFSRNIGLMAREYVRTHHDNNGIMRDLQRVYDEVLAER